MTRHRITVVLLMGLLLAAVVFAPMSGGTRLLRVLHNSAHGPIFGSIAILLLVGLRSQQRLSELVWPWQYLIAFAGATLLGIATEVAQVPMGRDASWEDVRNDVLGALGFLALFAVFSTHLPSRAARIACLLLGLTSLSVLATPVLVATAAYARRAADFPVLADFGARFERFFIAVSWAEAQHTRLPETWARKPGELGLLVRFGQGPWPGLNFHEPAPDWSGYSMLVLDVTNPDDASLEFTLRIHDSLHNWEFVDRFNQRLRVPPRTRSILRVPLSEVKSAPHARPMDLQEIAGMLMFKSSVSEAKEMYLSRIWLE